MMTPTPSSEKVLAFKELEKMTLKATEEDMFLFSQLLSKPFSQFVQVQKNYFQGKIAYVLPVAFFCYWLKVLNNLKFLKKTNSTSKRNAGASGAFVGTRNSLIFNESVKSVTNFKKIARIQVKIKTDLTQLLHKSCFFIIDQFLSCSFLSFL